jgi:hypothetical protein
MPAHLFQEFFINVSKGYCIDIGWQGNHFLEKEQSKLARSMGLIIVAPSSHVLP